MCVCESERESLNNFSVKYAHMQFLPPSPSLPPSPLSNRDIVRDICTYITCWVNMQWESMCMHMECETIVRKGRMQ